MGRYLDIARRTKRRSDHDGIVDVAPEPGSYQLPVLDPYAEAMRTALERIKSHGDVVGMVFWLDTNHRDLYLELTSTLPDEIHRLWSGRAPLERFEITLSRLISLHCHCCGLYRASNNEVSADSFDSHV